MDIIKQKRCNVDTTIISIICFILSLYTTAGLSEVDKAKHEIIEAVFHDDDNGYGSKSTTLKHATQIHRKSYYG